jgi:hypothetical protein
MIWYGNCLTKENIILKFLIMRTILYIIAIILVIGWLLGFFVYSAGALIHVLLVLAVVALLLGLLRRGPDVDV